MISYVVPAYNEERLIGSTLARLRQSAEAIGEPFEIIVVDDASTDRTAEVADGAGAQVLHVSRRQIGAARNEGARASRGDILVFVDADTLVSAETIRAMVAALREGAVGGGAKVDFDRIPLSMHLFWRAFAFFYHLLGLAAGCFIFARRDAFQAIGGFDERYFASEEVHLSRALRRHGRFVLLPQRVLTSGRKCRLYTPAQVMFRLIRILVGGSRVLKSREALDIWYGGKREE